MILFEEQRLPFSKKDKVWRQNQTDAICSRMNQFSGDWYKIWQNYRMKNNQINQEEYREYCDTLGLQHGEGNKFVEPFNKSHIIIEEIKGEEAGMPWPFGVINVSPKATNEVIREKEGEYRNYIDSKLANLIDKQKQITEAMIAQKVQGMPPVEADKIIKKITEEFNAKEAKLLDPAKIEAKYSSYKTKKEKTINKLLKALTISQNLKWLKNKTFEDALMGAREFVEICVDEYTKIPYVKEIDILNTIYHKTSNTPFVQDGDYAGYKEEVIVSDVLDRYSDELDEATIKRLRLHNGSVFGTNAKFSSPGGESPSKWENMSKYEYTYQHPLSTVPSSGTTNVVTEGLYASDRSRTYDNYCVVYTVYWRSQRSVGKLTYTNEDGESITTIVGEDYPVPARAKKVNYTPHMFSKALTKWVWKDSNDNDMSLEWTWIPEIWKGVRINGDIYVKIEPVEHAYQSLLNPYKTKLPIHGYIYDNRNAFSVSTYDRIKPWQKLYYIVAAKWIKLITQDKGIITLLNMLMMDKALGHERALQIAIDHGFLPYNPLANTQGLGGVVGQMHAAERLDLSNIEQLTYYTKILDFIEQQMKMGVGMTDARLAQTSSSSNVTDNQRDMQQSMNITNSIFLGHDMLWQSVLQTLCEVCVKTLDSKSGFIRQILSDDEIALIDLGLISLEDEYVVMAGNNAKSYRTLQEVKAQAQALIQLDKTNLSTFIDLLETDNITEFKENLKEIEYEIEQREQRMQEAQQQHEKEMLEKQQEQLEAERAHSLEEIKLKGEYDLLKAQITAMSWDPEKDRDEDGLPDILEIEKFRNQQFTDKEKLAIENHRLAQQDQKLELEQTKMQMQDNTARNNLNQQAVMKDREMKQKAELEKMKIKSRPKPTKK